jgi:GNAT superfamily N-acetyltransferase
MTDVLFSAPTWGDVWWAVGREFAFLPPVDPAFAPRNLGLGRRLLLRLLVLPLNYRRHAFGRIAARQGERVGYLFARPRGSGLNIDSLGVAAESRRQGLGRRLLAQAEAHARQEGLDYLTAILPRENRPGQAFFAALGFRAYRPEAWRLEAARIQASGKGTWTLRELAAVETLPAYERWQRQAVQAGDAWAAELLLESYLRQGWRGAARHWACLIQGEEAGYLRLAGLSGRYQAYLACKPSAWKLAAQAHWLDQAVKSYAAPLQALTLELACGDHHAASREVWQAAGFSAEARPRFLMIKKLKPGGKKR